MTTGSFFHDLHSMKKCFNVQNKEGDQIMILLAFIAEKNYPKIIELLAWTPQIALIVRNFPSKKLQFRSATPPHVIWYVALLKIFLNPHQSNLHQISTNWELFARLATRVFSIIFRFSKALNKKHELPRKIFLNVYPDHINHWNHKVENLFLNASLGS